jgi:hypothetical protein
MHGFLRRTGNTVSVYTYTDSATHSLLYYTMDATLPLFVHPLLCVAQVWMLVGEGI